MTATPQTPTEPPEEERHSHLARYVAAFFVGDLIALAAVQIIREARAARPARPHAPEDFKIPWSEGDETATDEALSLQE